MNFTIFFAAICILGLQASCIPVRLVREAVYIPIAPSSSSLKALQREGLIPSQDQRRYQYQAALEIEEGKSLINRNQLKKTRAKNSQAPSPSTQAKVDSEIALPLRALPVFSLAAVGRYA
jgi:hypothetical protein